MRYFCIIFPVAYAIATDASLPLGSMSPYNKLYNEIISPACNYAEVPGIVPALSETRIVYNLASTLYLMQVNRHK